MVSRSLIILLCLFVKMLSFISTTDLEETCNKEMFSVHIKVFPQNGMGGTQSADKSTTPTTSWVKISKSVFLMINVKEKKITHLSLHLLRKIPLLSGLSLLQEPLSVRAHITRRTRKDILRRGWVAQTMDHLNMYTWHTKVQYVRNITYQAQSFSSP